MLRLKRYLAKRQRNIERKGPASFLEALFAWAWNRYRLVKNALHTSQSPFIAKTTLSLKNAERILVSGVPSFVSYEQLLKWTIDWSDTISRPDLIVAIPRSGLLVGNIIALRKGCPLAVPGMDKGESWVSKHIERSEFSRILLVDDSCATGESMARAKEQVRVSYPHARIETAALIVSKDSKQLVDYCGVVIEPPRIFEWNFLHSKKGVIAFDLDGVIAQEPANPGMRDHMETYKQWIRGVDPFLIPTYRIDAIISNRPEAVRSETEEWLNRYNVKYDHLLLAPNEVRGPKHEFKRSALLKIKPDMFVESSASEARALARETKIPVLCIECRALLT